MPAHSLQIDEIPVRGAPQAGPDAAGQPSIARLIVLSGQAAGTTFQLGPSELSIGRAEDCQIRLDDEGVSRKHARISASPDGTVRLVDLGSTNGTWCDGERIGQRVLRDGDKIQMGGATILKLSHHGEGDDAFARQTYEHATRDALTKLHNRKFFTDQLHTEFSYALRHETPLTAILLGVDHLDRVNEAQGHAAGDFVLTRLAQLLVATLRGEDTVARLGGATYGILLRECPQDHGYLLADRLRRKVEAATFVFGDRGAIPITIGLGHATLAGGSPAAAEALLAAAEGSLARARHSGRNQVEPGPG